MFKNTIEDPRQGQSGQALALGAGSMLVLALMLMFSLNVSQAIHEKIRIQNYADAQAYSMAVQEARAFNYIAYTNRAMAAAYVSAMSLHAYMAAASVVPVMAQRAAFNFLVMAGIEFALCCACTYCACVQHCIEGIENIMIAFDYFDMSDDKADDVKDLESMFGYAMMSLEAMIDAIHFSQQSMLARTQDLIMGFNITNHDFQATLKGSVGAELTTDNQFAPHATDLPIGVGLVNARELACAVERPPLLAAFAIGCPSVSRENRARVMTEVANGTRPEWPASRPFFPIHLSPTWLMDFMFDIPDDGITVPLMHDGTAKLVEDTSTNQLEDGNQGREGKVMGADEHGMVFSWKDHAAMILPYSASIFSDENGGDHDPSDAHDGDHDFNGVNAGDLVCLINTNCFIKFRADSDKSDDWGQPSVYAFTTQDLTLRGSGDAAAKPWEITESGELTLTHGAQGDATVRLAPGTGMAMSKALVYYHRLGDWQEQPNLFNPYWRAKLHPFKQVDAALVLAAAGQIDWAIVAALPTVPRN